MGIHGDVYEFAARAGAFEGYVYDRSGLDPASLVMWVNHLVEGYNSLPPEVRAEFQSLLDGTLGRAVQSLLRTFGEDHDLVKKLMTLTSGKIPSSPDDFPNRR